ncbi:MAG TPA: hypothetical protein VMS01_00560 [Stellaceae bacterium]|nr:hypothetical protein [Stellaceae bacterium]
MSASTRRRSTPAIACLPRIEHRPESAFALNPRAAWPVDWLFSDVVCYPARLLGLAERWLAAGTCRRFVCTVKFQGRTDHAVARRFAIAGRSCATCSTTSTS